MTQYNTGNAVPSSDMPDAWDNNATIDIFVNSPDLSVTTRTGIERDTMAGIQQKSADQREQIATDGAAVVEETRQNLIPLSRQYMTLADAQEDIANIPDGSATYVRSTDGSSLADEYINNGGTLEATGRVMPSQGYVDRVINISTDNTNITVTFDSDGGVVDVRDAFGGVNIPDIPSPVQDILKQIKKNASPFLNVLTDAENQAFESVCDFGSLRIPGIPVGIAEMLQATRKKTEKLYKYRRVIDAREFGLNSKTGEDAHRAIQAGYDALSARGGGVLYIPEGYYKLAVPIIPRPNVSLIGAGQNATVLLPFGYLAAITYQGAETYIENLQFSDFTIDGENQQLHPVNGYIPDIKGIYLQCAPGDR